MMLLWCRLSDGLILFAKRWTGSSLNREEKFHERRADSWGGATLTRWPLPALPA